MAAKVEPPPLLVIDGTNLLWQDAEPKTMDIGRITGLASELIKKHIEFVFYFDASTRYQIKENHTGPHLEVFEKLLGHRDKFKQAAAKTQADSFILELADAETAEIISNDTYSNGEEGEKFVARYPWILSDKGRLHKFSPVRNILYVPTLRIRATIDADPSQGMDRLFKLMSGDTTD